MPHQTRSMEQIIGKLREAEVLISQGQTIAEAAKAIGVTDHTYYRWRKEYGGLRTDQAQRLTQLEVENLSPGVPGKIVTSRASTASSEMNC